MVQARKAAPIGRAPASRPAQTAYAYTLPTDSPQDLSRVKLPRGVKVALVSSNPDAIDTLKKKGRLRLRKFGKIERAAAERDAGTSGSVDRSAFEPGPRARALLRGVQIARADLEATGGAYDFEQVQDLLHGVSRQRIDRRVKEGTLLAVPGPSNRRRYPAVQFTDEGDVVEGLDSVQAALPTRNPWAVLNFLVQPDDRLDGRAPIDVLKAGQIDLAVAAARNMGQQGG